MFKDKENLDLFIGRRIREHRKKAGLTLLNVSKDLGISLQQLQKYEQGKTRISAGLLLQLTQVFNVSFDYFYDGYDLLVQWKEGYQEEVKTKRTNPLNVLIVESDIIDRFNIRNYILEFDKKFNVFVLDQEVQVLSFLRSDTQVYPFPKPDLIFLAFDSKSLDGFYLLKEIKRDPKIQDIPVIMLSRSMAKEDLLRCYKNHASGYIQKYDLKSQIAKTISYWSSICLPHM